MHNYEAPVSGISACRSQARVLQAICEERRRMSTFTRLPAEPELDTQQEKTKYQYRSYSLLVFGPSNPFRQNILKIIKSKGFDYFVILSILMSSMTLGIYDYRYIDRNPKSPSYANPVTSGSTRNLVAARADLVFTGIFTVEMCLKIIGLGFFWGNDNAYLRDGWNVLDFVITFGSLVALLPMVPSLKMFRICRLLRPLRTIGRLPGLRKIVNSMIRALPQMKDVLLFLFLSFFIIFDILGISLFVGTMSSVCRLTPFPVKTNWEPGMNATFFRCLDAPNLDVLPTNSKWTKKTSPWAIPQDCFWPHDDSDRKLCSPKGFQGKHKCKKTWCGSNYDNFGNPRFTGNTFIPMYAHFFTKEQLLAWPVFTPELNYGYTTFDSALLATVPVFQATTLMGLSDILFMLGDSNNLIISAIFFVIFALLVPFVVLNLVVAVFENQLHCPEDSQTCTLNSPDSHIFDLGEKNLKEICIARQGPTSIKVIRRKGSLLQDIVGSRHFTNCVTTIILLNAAILAANHYPSAVSFDSKCEQINFFCTVFFCVDMVLKMATLGVVEYIRDNFYLFDSILVLLSLFELGMTPPAFLTDKKKPRTNGTSALRTLRLLRLFKLAKQWKTMQVLFGKLIKSSYEMANFLLLLFLFIYIMGLVGMQFFANRYRFDEFGYRIEINDPRWSDAAPPRANFDTITWALFSVFSIVTLEDWNKIMYNGWRATEHGASALFFILVVLFGQIIMMNLFLSILLSNFTEESDEKASESQVSQVSPDAIKRNSDTIVHLETIAQELCQDPDDSKTRESAMAVFPLSKGKTVFMFGPENRLRLACVYLLLTLSLIFLFWV